VLLSELLSAERVRIPLVSRTKADLLRELVELATDGDPSLSEVVLAAVHERERVLSTGIGDGVAIPHGRTPHARGLMVAAGAVRDPLEFDALDGAPVRLFFLLVGPDSDASAHIKALSRIARLLRREPLRLALVSATSGEEFLRAIRDAEAL
jgi:mannitol/fructose-specific phosphotransferase system IIA component (Ntr-type)